MVIYPVDSLIQPWNNPGQEDHLLRSLSFTHSIKSCILVPQTRWRVWERTGGYRSWELKSRRWLRGAMFAKVFSTKSYGVPSTSALPEYRTEGSRPFEVTGVDFAGPFRYKVGKKEEGKCYVIIFTCASSRAVHLEVARTQTADEFK